MKKMKKLTATLLVAVMALGLAGCGGGGNDSKPAAGGNAEPEKKADTVVVQLATTVNEQDSFQVAAEKFKELVEERTDGAYQIEIYPNGTLGDERALLESMAQNTIEMGIITSGPFVNFAPEMGVLDMPFLFASNEEAYKVLDGEVGKELLGTLEQADLKGLAYAERGFRNLTNSVRPIHDAEDLAGLKLRIMENEVFQKTFDALGANAQPMAWSDTLTALQQGTIEGEENPVNVIYSYKLWESQKYVTMTRHAYSTAIITASLDFYNKLPEDVQTIFTDAAQEAAEYERDWVAQHEEEQMQSLLENNMEVDQDPDMESFRSAVQSVYDAYPQYAEYMEKIQATLAK